MTSFLTQTITDVGGPVPGDCWRTAIACLLDLADPTQVPHFVHEHDGMSQPDDWWDATICWIEEQVPGRTLAAYDPVFPFRDHNGHQPAAVIASGPSPRGDFLHAVLADPRTGELIWDPHPSRAGLAGELVDVVALVFALPSTPSAQEREARGGH